LESTFMPGTIFLSGAMNSDAAPGSGMFWFAGSTRATTSMPKEGAEYIITPVIPRIIPPVISGTPDFLASFSEFSPEWQTTMVSSGLNLGTPSRQMTVSHPHLRRWSRIAIESS